jgi:valyl-tRNA synthetase
VLTVGDDYKKTILEGYKRIIAEQGRCESVRVQRAGSGSNVGYLTGPVATAMAADVEVIVPLMGLVDPAVERAKLAKELEKVVSDRDWLLKKMENPKYLANAKPEAIEKDRAKLIEVQATIVRLDSAIDRLAEG